MIQTVEKIYFEGDFLFYKTTLDNNKVLYIPHETANRHYQEILEWVAEGNTITDNGGGE